jgi:hypothetical protein
MQLVSVLATKKSMLIFPLHLNLKINKWLIQRTLKLYHRFSNSYVVTDDRNNIISIQGKFREERFNGIKFFVNSLAHKQLIEIDSLIQEFKMVNYVTFMNDFFQMITS